MLNNPETPKVPVDKLGSFFEPIVLGEDLMSETEEDLFGARNQLIEQLERTQTDNKDKLREKIEKIEQVLTAQGWDLGLSD